MLNAPDLAVPDWIEAALFTGPDEIQYPGYRRPKIDRDETSWQLRDGNLIYALGPLNFTDCDQPMSAMATAIGFALFMGFADRLDQEQPLLVAGTISPPIGVCRGCRPQIVPLTIHCGSLYPQRTSAALIWAITGRGDPTTISPVDLAIAGAAARITLNGLRPHTKETDPCLQ